MKITINDVARAAGVSKGTVDRVIHNRGEVSEASRKKVMKVIESLGYKPNVYASMLAMKKVLRIVAVIPEYKPGEFWGMVAKGLETGAGEVRRYGVEVQIVTYYQYDSESFRIACDKALTFNPSGVILSPIFHDETLSFVERLEKLGIVHVYFDSRIDGTNYLGYFGMPMTESGYLAAHMLNFSGKPSKVMMARIKRDKQGLSDPTRARRNGFLAYMDKYCPDTKIVNVFIDTKDPEHMFDELEAAYREDEEIVDNIVMFNSRVHFVARWLKDKGLVGKNLIGFDVLPSNLQAVKEGYIRYLIGQHCDTQAATAVRTIVDHLLKQDTGQRRDNFTQMDILCKYNCDYY